MASFNAMAAEVEASRRRLEHAVELRTDELQRAQDSLARREKLALIGHLASNVGHEIRNPLGVMANAVFYLQTIQPDAPAEVRQYLELYESRSSCRRRSSTTFWISLDPHRRTASASTWIG